MCSNRRTCKQTFDDLRRARAIMTTSWGLAEEDLPPSREILKKLKKNSVGNVIESIRDGLSSRRRLEIDAFELAAEYAHLPEFTQASILEMIDKGETLMDVKKYIHKFHTAQLQIQQLKRKKYKKARLDTATQILAQMKKDGQDDATIEDAYGVLQKLVELHQGDGVHQCGSNCTHT